MILGYLTNSLPEGTLTDFNHKTVEKFASSWIVRTSAKAWKAFICISRRCLFLGPPNKEDDLDEGQRKEALKKFILTLSDQQLVTGIAILSACFLNWCNMSVYELNMVISLAFFSSSTHLATLNALHVYFQRNHVVRTWRIVGVVALLLLLIAGLVLNEYYSGNNFSVPIPCLTKRNSSTIHDCNVTFLDNCTNYANNPRYNDCIRYASNTSGTFSFGLRFESVFFITYLGYIYAHAVLGTFTISGNRPLTPSHILVYLVLCTMRQTTPVSRKFVDSMMIEIWAMKRTISKHNARLLKSKVIWVHQLTSIHIIYVGSILYRIVDLLILLSWGLSQVATSRWAIDIPRLKAESTRLDFGQIVPLVLLVLPLLAVVEIFNGKLAPRTTFMY